ncbi:MAG: saccharopine dehydrogenase NADP-binding domain-containing protein [Reichenbachiella sp.]|uniref:saccharopine dehydrogenase family protein n=2 Tax=Reichenbachiella sp. TaxID=2184521 RepID=UPI00326493C9
MPMKFLIYGAYGYTGQLISKLAKAKGYSPILAGRDEIKTQSLANELELEYTSFDLSDSIKLEATLNKVDIVLHCAGPFSATAKVMMEACIRTKTHYLDITGEIEVFELGASMDQVAKDAGILIMPGVGFDVVPSDCLAAYLKLKLPDANHLELAFMSESSTSRGTALTMTQGIGKGGAIRKDGKIIPVPHAYRSRSLNLDGKEKSFVSIPWGDVSTAYYSTGIPNIMVYTAMHPGQIKKIKMVEKWRWFFNLSFVQNYLQNKVRKTVTGPTEQMRENSRCYLWGEVKNDKGEIKSAKLTTLEGYKLTAITSLMVIEEMIKELPNPGYQTPSKAFGADFIIKVENTNREDI